jgi:hypothetical protein
MGWAEEMPRLGEMSCCEASGRVSDSVGFLKLRKVVRLSDGTSKNTRFLQDLGVV